MYVVAWSKSKTETVYRDENGGETVRSGGSRSWRNCNPGNISKGSFAEACGAIGSEVRFAIFPDEETGKAAIVSLFKSKSYKNLTLRQAIFKYAPPDDDNNSEAYVAVVAKALKVSPEIVVKELIKDQLASLSEAIKEHEGWKAGQILPAGSAKAFLAAAELSSSTSSLAEKLNLMAATSGDASKISSLVQIASDPQKCAEIRAKAFKRMTRIYGEATAKNACACTLSTFLQAGGIDVEVEYGAGKLARILEKTRGWQRVSVGQQQPGDVGVTLDQEKPFGADHVFLVVERIDADEMIIADNQTKSCPHPRFASGRGGKTPVDYFLRASGSSSLFSLQIEGIGDIEAVDEDQDTNDLVVKFNDDGTPIPA